MVGMNFPKEALIRAHQEALMASMNGAFEGSPLSTRTREAFFAVPRHLFLERYREYASPEWQIIDEISLWQHLPAIYRCDGLGIHGNDGDEAIATISGPYFVLWMLEQLALERGMRVLEIGAGSGWNAGLLGWLVGPEGSVDSVEIIPDLARQAARGVARAGLQNVRIIEGDAGAALDEGRAYDRVVFTAGSYDLPAFLYDAVRPGGLLQLVLKCPGGGDVLFMLRRGEQGFSSESARRCEFVPLTGRGRLRELDAAPLASFGPWAELEAKVVAERPFYMGERGGPFLSRTFPLRSHLAIVEPRMRWFHQGFGLHDEPSGSLSLARDGRITVHGSRAAGEALDQHLQRWLALGMPSMASMSLRAFPAAAAPAAGAEEWLVRRPETDFLFHI